VKACVAHGANDLRVEERPVPEPGPGEVAVRMVLGGICGTDVHYYRYGAVGDFKIVEPLVLGHEVVGRIAALGDGVSGLAVSARVAVHPATPCGACDECLAGRRNLCTDARYLGSAARVPHVQGGFAEQVVVPASQLRELPPGLDLHRAVLAEPLGVALHAVSRAGPVAGQRALVTGAGPIGLLVVVALRYLGAAEVTASDILAAPLALARKLGADSTVLAGDATDQAWPRGVDVAIEASGAPSALLTCIELVRPAGTVVQVGSLPGGGVTLPGHRVVSREITLRGSFRFDTEFDQALSLLASGPDLSPLITHSFPLRQAVHAFQVAGDRNVSAKVLLELTEAR